MILVTFDPGVKALGASVYRDGRLTACALIKHDPGVFPLYFAAPVDRFLANAVGVDLVDDMFLEKPQVYKASKGDPNDLIDLAIVDGFLSTWVLKQGGRLHMERPATWKGQVPKSVTKQRVQGALTPEEARHLDRAKWNHNVVDAVAMGLWCLGRQK